MHGHFEHARAYAHTPANILAHGFCRGRIPEKLQYTEEST